LVIGHWSLVIGHLPEEFRMATVGFEKLKLLKQEEIDALKPMMDELSPKLNAYLKSIGPAKDQ
jgi:hypothetical protein